MSNFETSLCDCAHLMNSVTIFIIIIVVCVKKCCKISVKVGKRLFVVSAVRFAPYLTGLSSMMLI